MKSLRFWVIFITGMGKDSKAQSEPCAISLEDGAHVDKVPVCLELRKQHSPERQHQLIGRGVVKMLLKPDETWVGYRKRTAKLLRNSWRKMGVPLLIETIASKNWPTLTWAVCEGDVPLDSGVENDSVVEKPGLMGYDIGTLPTLHEEYNGTHRWQGGVVKRMTG